MSEIRIFHFLMIHNSPVSGEVILSAENSGKPLGGRSAAQNITGGAHSAPPDPLVAPTWWEGSFCHFPRIPPALGIRP